MIGLWHVLATPIIGPVLACGLLMLTAHARPNPALIAGLVQAAATAALAAGYTTLAYWLGVAGSLLVCFHSMDADTDPYWLGRFFYGGPGNKQPSEATKQKLGRLRASLKRMLYGSLAATACFVAAFVTRNPWVGMAIAWALVGVAWVYVPKLRARFAAVYTSTTYSDPWVAKPEPDFASQTR